MQALTGNRSPLSTEFVCRTLMRNGLITKDQVKEVFEKKESLKKRLEGIRARQGMEGNGVDRVTHPITIIDILTPMNLIRADDSFRGLDEDIIYKTLAREWGYPFKKIDPLKLDYDSVTSVIPRTFARKHMMLPIGVANGQLTVATPNPFNLEAIEDITRVSNLQVDVVVSPKSDILRLIDEFFGFKQSIAAAEVQFTGPTVDLGNLEQYVRLKSIGELSSNDQHIVNAVSHLFVYAFDQRASDIHIEPKRDTSLVRMRIDGVLHTVYKLPKNVHSAVVSRIKNMSRLDMAEKRRPQDGRIKTDKDGVEAEIRVSTVPVAFGEKVVMRILDPDILFQDLAQLGFTPTDLIRYNQFAHMPHGILLVTGPTGSGKSTTLYSTLRDLASPKVNITTIEDPIEMVHEDFNQIAVQPAVGITFATILRNILRQDPDIIMIGEMRDLDTGENAIQAALTGHLVLSTLHTNDAPSALMRLIELGIPGFLIKATLVGIVAQRLVRTICRDCIEAFDMAGDELRTLGLDLGRPGQVRLYRGKGCQKCRGTGYRGRTGVFEVMPYSDALKRLTEKETDIAALRQKAVAEGMVTLRESAVQKMLDGLTTYQEVLRVTWESY